jgi:Transposase DDE domain
MLRDKVIGIYCLVDDILKGIDHYEPSSRKVSDSEVITTAIVSALYFKGNQSHSINYMRSHNMIDMIGKSGFTKRLHQLAALVMWMFLDIGRMFKYVCAELEYIIDSFPVKACHNMRISRCKLLKGKQWRGYNASKREYFFGVKVQLIVTKNGVPVELCFMPGSEHDIDGLRKMTVDLPGESIVYGDSAYTEYELEELFKETELIDLKISRKSNSLKPDKPWEAFIKTTMRKRIETTISEIIEMTPQSIHAVTQKGFLIKLLLFVLAYQLKTII